MKTKTKIGKEFYGLNFLNRSFKWFIFFILLALQSWTNEIISPVKPDSPVESELRVSTFDIDVTPPVGYPLAYDIEINKWDLGLRAKGIVILGAGKPIVLCAIDAIGIGDEGNVLFRQALAAAAGTTPERVSVHTLHQHDAPRFDPSAEKLLLEAGHDPKAYQHIEFDGTWGRETISNLTIAVRKSLSRSQPVNYIGLGKAAVHEVVSNRDIYKDKNGKVIRPRFSSTKGDSLLRSLPVGTVDSTVSVVSFWDDDKPVAILSFFATHPQSYYRTGIANPDFVGVARFFRQLAVPDALHIHFNGAAGDVAAGKYNDGSHIMRLVLAERLADGMKRAWEATKRQPVTAKDVDWFIDPVALPPNKDLYKLRRELQKNDTVLTAPIAQKIVFLNRYEAGEKIDCGCLKIKNARILFMPGELFVEYQLAAKAMRPDLFVTMAAYGDYGTSYIGTAEAYGNGGYETSDQSNVSPGSEGILMKAMQTLLNR